MVNMSCPTDEVIEKYALGRASESESIEWEEHLLSCASCVERAEELDAFIAVLAKATADDGSIGDSYEERSEPRARTDELLEIAFLAGDRVTCRAIDRSVHGLGLLSPRRLLPGMSVRVVKEGRITGAVVRNCATDAHSSDLFRVGLCVHGDVRVVA